MPRSVCAGTSLRQRPNRQTCKSLGKCIYVGSTSSRQRAYGYCRKGVTVKRESEQSKRISNKRFEKRALTRVKRKTGGVSGLGYQTAPVTRKLYQGARGGVFYYTHNRMGTQQNPGKKVYVGREGYNFRRRRFRAPASRGLTDWQRFMKANADRGLSMTQLSAAYRATSREVQQRRGRSRVRGPLRTPPLSRSASREQLQNLLRRSSSLERGRLVRSMSSGDLGDLLRHSSSLERTRLLRSMSSGDLANVSGPSRSRSRSKSRSRGEDWKQFLAPELR